MRPNKLIPALYTTPTCLHRLITLSKLITSADSALFHQVVAIYFSSQGVRSTIPTPTTHLSVGVFYF
ncbi:hypothetical protein THOG11_50105 [Vibrio harveyi]|nr:hypothetical protein TH15OA1_500126 [Vibrio harveyi]CAH1539648.1 hypothetical protein VHARVF571_470040 [Vibrio harveyi]CAH1569711.1 hypothetical protein THOD03_40104 [Vibrio harveyi]CAH1579790.1 hypothetical protein THOG11_50105 [Vibrio harveyi]